MSTPPLALDALRGRTVLVTGASSGIGLATATAAATAGARVVVAVRDPAKGQRACAGLPGPVEVRHLDLADLASVRAFAAGWQEPLGVLVNNAGTSLPTFQRSGDGVELQLATNHLGPYALTNLLLPHVTGRVVTLASLAERTARVDPERLDELDGADDAAARYRESRAYARSKLANLLFTAALARRLEAAGSPVRALAAHPGFVATGMTGASAERGGPVLRAVVRHLAQPPSEGALPVLLAATADLPSGTFTGPRHLAHMRGGAQVIRASARARDADLADRLWAWSQRRSGVGFGLAPSGSDGRAAGTA